jgi:hypothetical protein
MLNNTMKKKTNRFLKLLIATILIGFLGLLFGARSAYARYYLYEGIRRAFPRQCYVSPGQTVVEWKSGTYQTSCRISVEGICLWPIPHKHVTYKVTVNDGTALRTRRGAVIPAINGEEKTDWVAYDSNAWNSLPNNPFEKYSFTDFEPIASNEYVVMVQTRYRLFNNVDSTLGICTQQ